MLLLPLLPPPLPHLLLLLLLRLLWLRPAPAATRVLACVRAPGAHLHGPLAPNPIAPAVLLLPPLPPVGCMAALEVERFLEDQGQA